jgi:hypothetical protein
MGRERGEQVLPDLFSMDAVRDASTPQHATTDATAEPKPQRHILPKNLRNAVEHLSDGELDLLHTATFEAETARKATTAVSAAKSVSCFRTSRCDYASEHRHQSKAE